MYIDSTFAGDYELTVAGCSDPADAVAYQYPPGTVVDLATFTVPARTVRWSNGVGAPSDLVTMDSPNPVQVQVRPAAADHWVGIFHAQLTSPRGVDCAVSLPDRQSLAVLSNGAVYRVWAADPSRWQEISSGGVMDPVVVTALELVLLVGHTTILAYGSAGLAWESERLAWDDLEAVAVAGEHLRARGFDAPRNEIVAFTVDLRTGRSQDAPHPDRRLHRSN